MSNRIGIIGAGGQADEAESYLQDAVVEYRAVDSAYADGKELLDKNLLTSEQLSLPVVVAVGSPYLRKKFVDSWRGTGYATIMARSAAVHTSTTIGDGSIIAENATITTNSEVGDHTIVNIGVTISHNVKIGNYVTISPGANIAGNVTIGDGVFIGIGAIVKNGVTIAPGTVIGAGAVVINDITDENCTYVGVPAKCVAQNEGWMREI
ncbi:TPA: hypothetical protein DIV49_00300 [Candidatus Saccharibacteria bacterium]|mgnify:FL=1|nr:hypothetical protein [Candidatus Saccharibacteria bacterium]HRF28115.1 acetyltransferase [Candidatus Saccharibacteria bacterium]HRJ91240.1 acetyltransferase [Candidatus Saccharibacteria bacterium]